MFGGLQRMNAAQAGSSDWLRLAQIGRQEIDQPSEDQFPLPADPHDHYRIISDQYRLRQMFIRLVCLPLT